MYRKLALSRGTDSRYSVDMAPYATEVIVEEGAAGTTDVDAIVVMDGISDARVSPLEQSKPWAAVLHVLGI